MDRPSTDASYGPFRPGMAAAERCAQLRALAALTLTFCGHGQARVVAMLRAAETDDAALPAAMAALDRLPAVPRRRLLANFARLHHPAMMPPPNRDS